MDRSGRRWATGTTLRVWPAGLVVVLILGAVTLILIRPAPAGAAEPIVRIEDFAFAPVHVSTPAGTTVTWTNTAGREHTVTADDGSFDSGPIPAGEAFANVFEVTGTFKYHCSIHPAMTGTVTVEAARATDVPSGPPEPTPPPGTLPPSFNPNPTPVAETPAVTPGASAGTPADSGSGGPGAVPIVLGIVLVAVVALSAWIAASRRRGTS
jgi:plastocyanin